MTRTKVERARRALLAAFERTGELTSRDVLDASRRVDRLLAEFHRERTPAQDNTAVHRGWCGREDRGPWTTGGAVS